MKDLNREHLYGRHIDATIHIVLHFFLKSLKGVWLRRLCPDGWSLRLSLRLSAVPGAYAHGLHL